MSALPPFTLVSLVLHIERSGKIMSDMNNYIYLLFWKMMSEIKGWKFRRYYVQVNTKPYIGNKLIYMVVAYNNELLTYRKRQRDGNK